MSRSRSMNALLAVRGGSRSNSTASAEQNGDLRDLANCLFGAGIHVVNCDIDGQFTNFFSTSAKEASVGRLFAGAEDVQLRQMEQEVVSKGVSKKARLVLKRIRHGRVLKDEAEAERVVKFDVTMNPRFNENGVISGTTSVLVDLGTGEDESEVDRLRKRVSELEDLNHSLNSAKRVAEDAEHAKSDFLAIMSQ
jgi:hypothetical protein